MNIFDIISGIAFTKQKELVNNVEDEKSFNPYMCNRWLSMLDPSAAKIINLTTNRFSNIFTNNKDYYLFLLNILPKYRTQRITYIKKPTRESIVEES